MQKPIKTLVFCLLASTAMQASAEGIDSGAYLAGRQAAAASDFDTAARYFTQTLLLDPANPALLENALVGYVSLGRMDQAVPVAKAMLERGVESQMGHFVLFAEAAKLEDWMSIFDLLEAGHTVSPLVDGLSQSWAAVGLGKMGQALDSFDEVIATDGMTAYGLYHKALALASVGDFEGADDILGDPEQRLGYAGRVAIAHAQILSQLDRNADAIALLDSVFGDSRDAEIVAIRAKLGAGEKILYDVVTTPVQGMAEVALMVAAVLQGDAPDGYTLQYARLGQYLDPENTQATLLAAELLEAVGQHDLADATYALVGPDNPAFQQAELGRIDVLRQAGRLDAAIEVAQALVRNDPELPVAHAKLGDVLRGASRMEEANAAYTNALAAYGPDDPNRWLVLFSRAITYHSLDLWPEAEADFRAALALRPDQPQVLNYLGYSLVERNEKLDEALAMIETAVAGEPENGAIVDSLGWVYFQLGRYEDAVEPMERAASLEATDPIVNDHLGDVYWAVGRKIEAEFQWHRALSFNPDEELADRIRQKLAIGLDAVLELEGAAPLAVANDGG